ncbi:hypothetical protein ACBY01_17070 [Sphingomonas sp. ac-8]|uniref:hypothetical protein n=1 Tax=Sphingomonas sp. ac-8 TaxID=3242977 RepID=UPI003A80DE00
MDRRLVPLLTALLLGVGYWQLVCRIAAVAEPWDAPTYWTLAYPAALIASAAAGALLRRRAALASGLFVFSQLAVLWINAGLDGMWPVGVLFAVLLSLPAVAIATLARALASKVDAA